MHLVKGKIVLDSEIIKKYNDKYVIAEVDGNTIWSIDLKDNLSLKLLTQFSGESKSKRCFGDVIIEGNKLFFVPFSATSLYCLDMDTNETSCLLDFIGIANKKYKVNCKFMSGHIYGEYLYLMPAAFPGIVKLNLHTKQYFIIDKWIDEPAIKDLNDGYFRKTLLHDGKIYAPFCDISKMLVLDLKTDSVTLENIWNDHQGFSSVSIHNNKIYLSPRNDGEITVIDLGTSNKTKIDKEICGNAVLCEWGTNIVSSPSASGKVYVIDDDNNYVELLNSDGGYVTSVVSDDNLIVYLSEEGILRCYSNDMKLISEKYVRFELNNKNEENIKIIDILYRRCCESSNWPTKENLDYDLTAFISSIINSEAVD